MSSCGGGLEERGYPRPGERERSVIIPFAMPTNIAGLRKGQPDAVKPRGCPLLNDFRDPFTPAPPTRREPCGPPR